MLRVVFWQNIPSILQSAMIRNLANEPEISVTLVIESGLPARRQEMGWQHPDFGGAELIVAPGENTIERLIRQYPSRSVHIFSGLRVSPMVWLALRKAIGARVTIGVYSESGSWFGLKGRLRLLQSQYDIWRYGRHISFILSVGHMATRWFKMIGYPSNMIYPFGYFVENSSDIEDTRQLAVEASDNLVKLVFIGQCIHRKGLDILLRALKGLESREWQLKIVGSGKEQKPFELLSEELGISNRVMFLGAQNNAEAMRILSQSDVLVLPSRWDGWGAVINEALMRGVPVVCSDYCGAAVLTSDSNRGSVVSAGHVESLRIALSKWIEEGPINIERRQRIRKWSDCISGASAAKYLCDIIEHVRSNTKRPVEPWLQGIP